MALRERPALGVLPGQPDRDAFHEQAGKRERLAVAPVDLASLQPIAAPLELPLELRMDGEAVGDAQELLVQRSEPVGLDCGRYLGALRRWVRSLGG